MLPNDIGAYSIGEFAHSFNMSRSSVYAEIRAGRLKVAKIGARTIITRKRARDYQELLEREAESAQAREAAAERSRAKSRVRLSSGVA